ADRGGERGPWPGGHGRGDGGHEAAAGGVPGRRAVDEHPDERGQRHGAGADPDLSATRVGPAATVDPLVHGGEPGRRSASGRGCGTRLNDADIRAGVFETQPATAAGSPVAGLPAAEPAGNANGFDTAGGVPTGRTGSSSPAPAGGAASTASAEAPDSRAGTGQV